MLKSPTNIIFLCRSSKSFSNLHNLFVSPALAQGALYTVTANTCLVLSLMESAQTLEQSLGKTYGVQEYVAQSADL